jgi:hypothetical protein
MTQVVQWRDDAMNELFDARDRCVYHGRAWWMLNNAAFHLAELWLSESVGRPQHIIALADHGALVRG